MLFFHFKLNKQIDLSPFKGGINAINYVLNIDKKNKIIAAPYWTSGREFYFEKYFEMVNVDPGDFKNILYVSWALDKSDYFISFDIDYFDPEKNIRNLLTKKNFYLIKKYDQFNIYKKF